ncbi:unnamed protein product, partial [Ectocarpus sp. 12 AP-2014]
VLPYLVLAFLKRPLVRCLGDILTKSMRQDFRHGLGCPPICRYTAYRKCTSGPATYTRRTSTPFFCNARTSADNKSRGSKTSIDRTKLNELQHTLRPRSTTFFVPNRFFSCPMPIHACGSSGQRTCYHP